MLLLACVLVFGFALHAKVGVYGTGSQLDPSIASKLWTNDARLQPGPMAPTATLLWLAVFLSSLLCSRQVRRYVAAPAAIDREQRSLQYLRRFLRPPPTR